MKALSNRFLSESSIIHKSYIGAYRPSGNQSNTAAQQFVHYADIRESRENDKYIIIHGYRKYINRDVFH